MKSVVLLAAIAACLVMGTASTRQNLKRQACSTPILENLDIQIQLCARNVPVQQYTDPASQAAACVRKGLSRAKWGEPCSLEKVPTLLQSCLEKQAIDDSFVTPAVECISNALTLNVCC